MNLKVHFIIRYLIFCVKQFCLLIYIRNMDHMFIKKLFYTKLNEILSIKYEKLLTKIWLLFFQHKKLKFQISKSVNTELNCYCYFKVQVSYVKNWDGKLLFSAKRFNFSDILNSQSWYLLYSDFSFFINSDSWLFEVIILSD